LKIYEKFKESSLTLNEDEAREIKLKLKETNPELKTFLVDKAVSK